MRDSGTKFVLIAFVAILVQAGYVHSHAQFARSQGQVFRATSTVGAPTPPGSSLPEPTSAQQKPPGPIVITYQNGELTIDAFNAPLGDILRAVCNRTGALINVPPNATERITRNIGPGRVISVLGSLLNETGFNYLIEELGADQAAPVRVMLTSKDGSTRAQPAIEPADQTIVAVAAIPPKAEDAVSRQKAIAERNELIREIIDLRSQFMEQSLKDKERQ